MPFLIPSHASRPSDDPIFALNTEARARQRAGERVINATVGALLDDEGKLAVMPSMAQALREVPAEVAAAYAPIAGPEELLRAAARDVLGDRPELGLVAAAATPGGTGALRMAIESFLEPGQKLLTSSFYWGPYKTLATESGRDLVTFRMFDEHGGFDVPSFDRGLHAALDAQGRALVLLNTPCHNPTGYSLDDAEVTGIVEAVRRAASKGPISVVLDIAYAHYGAAALGATVDRLMGITDRALLLFAWSASKSFTEYGLRVGALLGVVPDEVERRQIKAAFSSFCRGTWSNCNAAGMAAVTRALVDPELSARILGERAALKAILDRRVARWNELAIPAGLRYPRYSGGFFTTVLCDGAVEAAERLKAEGIFVVPQAGALRVALCSVAEADIPRVVSAIARTLSASARL